MDVETTLCAYWDDKVLTTLSVESNSKSRNIFSKKPGTYRTLTEYWKEGFQISRDSKNWVKKKMNDLMNDFTNVFSRKNRTLPDVKV